MEVWVWVGFISLILGLLALDLGVLNRRSHTVSAAQALRWTGMFVTIALCFAGAVYFIYETKFLGIGLNVPQQGDKPPIDISGARAVTEYLQGYMLEYALSLDNIFVIALIFRYFAVPAQHQHRVLFWGIMGALILRGVMIGVGAAVIERFDWIIWVLGAFLVFTGVKLLLVSDDDKFDPETSLALKLTKKVVPLSHAYDGRKFFTHLADGTKAATPMFVALVVVEFTDVVFAVDSIPAIFGITLDPFIVFTSNVFAILGLRSLYFALAAMLDRFRYLKYSLAIVLAYVGVKMLLTMHIPRFGIDLDVHIHPAVSLGIIAVSLGVGVVLSLAIPPPNKEGTPDAGGAKDLPQAATNAIGTEKTRAMTDSPGSTGSTPASDRGG
jgi:tellurite resistance protein TerC